VVLNFQNQRISNSGFLRKNQLKSSVVDFKGDFRGGTNEFKQSYCQKL
jgi:hypothetical protein